jgi:hypothetical protein
LYALSSFPASELTACIDALTRQAGDAATAAPIASGTLSADLLDEARALLRVGESERAQASLGGVPGLFDVLGAGGLRRVRTLYRAEGQVRGGELLWSCGPTGGVAIDVDRDTATVAPIAADELGARLLALLPGA